MGIKNLHPFLRKVCPDIYQQHHLSEYRLKRFAIDLSIYLCKYKTIYGEKWLDALFRLICILRKWNIHMVFVYDSKAPPEKDRERQERRVARKKNEERILELELGWVQERNKYMGDNTIIDIEQMEDVPLKTTLGKKKKIWTMFEIDNELNRLRRTIFSITMKDIELTKELFEICRVPYLLAIGEAEATCSVLNKNGYVYGVLTEDTDVFAYGCPNMLSKLDFERETVFDICLDDILNKTELQQDQFLDFCIMCGTDYNTNLYRIGPDKAFKLIKKYNNIDEIGKKCDSLSITSLNHKRVREIFREVNFRLDRIPYCGIPEKVQLQMFCFHNNIEYDRTKIEEIFSEKNLEFR
jgi:5'-3' exonuclease